MWVEIAMYNFLGFERGNFVFVETKYDSVIDATEEFFANPTPEKLDNLLGYLLSNFKGKVSSETIRSVLKNTKNVNILDSDVLCSFPDSVIPVLLVREVFFNRRCKIDAKKLENWPKFFKKYYAHILEA